MEISLVISVAVSDLSLRSLIWVCTKL